MKLTHLPFLTSGFLSCVLLPSCSDILFVTDTSMGVAVAGDTSPVPDHVNVGFRRREFIYSGPGTSKEGDMLGTLDAEMTWNHGSAIHENFATGKAALKAAKQPVDQTPPEAGEPGLMQKKSPLTFISRTRFGLNLNLGGADDQSLPTMHLGYNRRVATRIEEPAAGEPLPSLIGEVSVHSTGFLAPKDGEKGPGAIFGEDKEKKYRLSDSSHSPGQVRVRQIFAVGRAAESQ